MIKSFTLPLRVVVGTVKAIQKEMPDKVSMPFEIKRKENDDGNTRSEAVSRGEG
jgi:hypothetical protein|tara:strand:- start:428 stop:589 length:162 start_codon:yes stop_codon:yes gene_type:complete